MSLTEIRSALDAWGAAGLASGVALLVRVERSAPRRPGARFAASIAGEVAGSISSGCVEADLAQRILAVVDSGQTGTARYGITDEMAAEVGLACGGDIEVLIRPHHADAVWDALRDVLDQGGEAVLVTEVSGSCPGRQLLWSAGGHEIGDPSLMDGSVEAVARELLDSGGSRLMPGPGGCELFAEAILPSPRLAIVGATPVAEALARFAASIGYRVTVIDPRGSLAREDRFPDASVLRMWPEEGLQRMGIDRHASVAVVAHDAKLDVPALASALRAGCRYVGLLGGRRTQERRREALKELGLSAEEVARVRGPIGIDIGAIEPAEIALSIAAELVSAQNRTRGS